MTAVSSLGASRRAGVNAMNAAMVRRAVGAGLATSLLLAIGVLLVVVQRDFQKIWPIVFVPVMVTGALAVNWALPRRGGAAAATTVGLIAGTVASLVSVLALYEASIQGLQIFNLVGTLRAPPFNLGPYNWFGDVPWTLPLLVPIGI